MDSITHLALGAVIGDAVGERKLGRKAIGWGAAAAYLPDLDVVASLWLSPTRNVLFHRGITHSFLFAVIMSLALAFLARRVHKNTDAGLRFWAGFFFIQIAVHIFIDLFNAYGAGLLEPFSDKKFSFNTLFVADPMFTVWPVIAALAIIFVRSDLARRIAVIGGLVLPAIYLTSTIIQKQVVISKVNRAIERERIGQRALLVTPTPLNSLLWFVSVADDQGMHISHVSVFDAEQNIRFHFFPQREDLLERVKDRRSLEELKRFAEGFYTAGERGDTLIFNNLRFGQMKGWEDPSAGFVFHYFLDQNEGANRLVMQRGRFAGWNRQTISLLMRRMTGEQLNPAAGNKK